MALEFSSEQSQIVSIFTAYRNDIDIYTEDEEKDKAFYKRLFSRLLDGTGIRVNDVHPLGPSDEVINACMADTDTTRKKLYIVDGDIYLMYNPKQVIDNLYVLNAYCMENLVIDEEAVCNTLCNFIGEYELEEVKNIFQYDYVISSHKDKLIELFHHLALHDKYCGYFELKSIGRYYTNKEFDSSLVDADILSIKQSILTTGGVTAEVLECELDKMKTDFPYTSETCMRIISGKDYLIHMMVCNAAKKLNYKKGHTKNAWKFNFANYCNLDRLIPLRNAIISATE